MRNDLERPSDRAGNFQSDGHAAREMGRVPRGPPAYLSCASLARELDCSESTIHEYVRRGVLPKPSRLSNGTVRWRWADVDAALQALAGGAENAASDPFVKGLSNVT
jgi:predicted DNA-binding transcriptional regulator AlpA